MSFSYLNEDGGTLQDSRITNVFSVFLYELFVLSKVSQSDVGTVNGKLPAKISSGRDICYFICNYSQSYLSLSQFELLNINPWRMIESLIN